MKLHEKVSLTYSPNPFEDGSKTFKDELLLVVEIKTDVFYPNSWEYREEGPFHTVKFLSPDGKFYYDNLHAGDSRAHYMGHYIFESQ